MNSITMRKLNFRDLSPFIKSLFTLVLGIFLTSQLYAEVEYAIPLNAEEHQIGNRLEWSTSTELNTHNFVIEKSIDGIQFENIGILEAAGMSGDQKSYRFLDVGVNDEKIFYRLKQVDLDGAYDYSQTVLLNKELSNQFMVVSMSNTTFNKTFDLTLDIIIDSEISYTIYTLKGTKVKEGVQELTYGLNDLQFNLEDEKEGFYKIVLILKEEEEETLVVQKVDDEEKKRENVASKRTQNGG